jgi:hypothetical protein
MSAGPTVAGLPAPSSADAQQRFSGPQQQLVTDTDPRRGAVGPRTDHDVTIMTDSTRNDEQRSRSPFVECLLRRTPLAHASGSCRCCGIAAPPPPRVASRNGGVRSMSGVEARPAMPACRETRTHPRVDPIRSAHELRSIGPPCTDSGSHGAVGVPPVAPGCQGKDDDMMKCQGSGDRPGRIRQETIRRHGGRPVPGGHWRRTSLEPRT